MNVLSHKATKLEEELKLSSEATIHIPDCLYTLQKTPFFRMAGGPVCKIVMLPYKYADNSMAVSVWKQVLENLINKKEIISYTFLPQGSPAEEILVEYPPSSSSSTSIG